MLCCPPRGGGIAQLRKRWVHPPARAMRGLVRLLGRACLGISKGTPLIGCVRPRLESFALEREGYGHPHSPAYLALKDTLWQASMPLHTRRLCGAICSAPTVRGALRFTAHDVLRARAGPVARQHAAPAGAGVPRGRAGRGRAPWPGFGRGGANNGGPVRCAARGDLVGRLQGRRGRRGARQRAGGRGVLSRRVLVRCRLPRARAPRARRAAALLWWQNQELRHARPGPPPRATASSSAVCAVRAHPPGGFFLDAPPVSITCITCQDALAMAKRLLIHGDFDESLRGARRLQRPRAQTCTAPAA
jgi:hypothetical protein